MKKGLSLFVAILLTVAIFGAAFAQTPQAILVVSFGTSYNDTRAATIGAIEDAVRAAYPSCDVRRAFTSQIIIDKLAERDNEIIDNVDQAMNRLVEDGVQSVIVQPTHIMHGYEYDKLTSVIAPYADKFASLKIGEPLLNSVEDYWNLIDVINAEYPLKDGEALVLMGHGTSHFANAAYAALDYMFKANGNDNVFIGTVEGYPDLEAVLTAVEDYAPSKVALAPLMIVAGDHANNDMAGDDADSWKTAFKSAGFAVEPILKGLGEFKGVHQMIVDHINDAIAQPENEK